MTIVAPTLRGTYGHTADQVGNADLFMDVTVEAGDLVIVAGLTSDYLHRARSDGPRWSGGDAFVERGASYGNSQWGNAYTWSARATVAGTHRIYCYFSGGNNGANYAMMRAFRYANTDGVGNQYAVRQSGAPQFSFTKQAKSSSVVFCVVDWNAANGTPAMVSGSAQDAFFNGGAAEYLFGRYSSTAAAGAVTVGASSPTNWKNTIAAVEVLSQDRDVTNPVAIGQHSVSLVGPTSIKIDWPGTTDDVGVVGYYVLQWPRDNQYFVVANLGPDARTFTRTGLSAATEYGFTVVAYDAAKNPSSPRQPLYLTTPAVPSVNKAFVGLSKPSLRVGTSLVTAMYVGPNQVWP